MNRRVSTNGTFFASTYLEMPPRLPSVLIISKLIRYANELVSCQIRHTHMVHNSTTPRRLAAEDVRAGGLHLVIAVDAMVQVDHPPPSLFIIK